MLIGGFQKFSLIDFPQKIAALIFTQGCPFLCHFCHNPELVLKNQFSSSIKESNILDFLKKRKNQLDAVVITGGEPAIQKDLIDFIKKIKDLNYLVKLDTNGIYPHVIKDLLNKNLIDYIAMDIKAPLEKYKLITQKNIDTNLIVESINLILSSYIDYEFRTTLVKNLHQFEDIEKITKLIKNAKLYILQKFISKITLNPNFSKYLPFSEHEMFLMKKTSEKYVKKCLIK
jgi:pyruvate formate lyase activating enzyme